MEEEDEGGEGGGNVRGEEHHMGGATHGRTGEDGEGRGEHQRGRR